MMNTAVLDRHALPRYRIELRDYHRIIEAGILAGHRIELLDGQLCEKGVIGPRHALAVDALNHLLMSAVAGRARVRVQNPVELDDYSEPEPDLVLARFPWQGYPASHPTPADVLLLVEVADSTLLVDLGAKRELYAQAGIAEYWVVDLTADCVHVHRQPGGGAYLWTRRVEPLGALDVAALPGLEVPALPLFT